VLVLLCSCSQTPPGPSGGTVAEHVDFSGAWELDYSQSDSLQERLDALVRDLNRDAQRRSQGRADSRAGSITMGGSGSGRGASIISLARIADYITQSQLLDIEQQTHWVKVKREGDFALECEFYDDEPQVDSSPLGREACGWNGRQLVFWLSLPEGLQVRHRLSLSPQGDKLGIATTVVSSKVAAPFTLHRIYNRYDPGSSGVRCEMTISRGRVCTTESPQE
jgi:hypothetical protein